MRRAVLWMLALAGCDRVFNLDPVRDGSSTGDAADIDARAYQQGCPATYLITLPSSTSYYQRLGPMAWREAAAQCVADKTGAGETHLAVFGNDTERAEAATVMGAVQWWIGFSDLHGPEDVFRWVTAENTGGYPVNKMLPWDSDQPDQVGAGCTEVRETGQFHDENCTDLDESLCECDAYPDVPANR